MLTPIYPARQVRGAAYPINGWGVQCDAPAPPSPPAAPAPPSTPNATATDNTETADDCGCVAGAARRATILSSATDSSVTIDTGAYFSGSGLFFPAFEGNASAELLAASGYDAFALNYRDFSAGASKSEPTGGRLIASYIDRARGLDPSLPPAVVTNLNLTADPWLIEATVTRASATPAGHIAPFALVPLADGRTAAVLNFIDPTHMYSLTPHYAARVHQFDESAVGALAMLRRLPGGLPDVVIAIASDTDAGFFVTDAQVAAAGGSLVAARAAMMEELIAQAVGVDVWLTGGGGTTHVQRNWAGDRVLVVPRHSDLGRSVDNISLTFDDDGLLQSATAGSIVLDCDVPEDPATTVQLAEYHASMTAIFSGVVGELTVDFDAPLKAALRGDTIDPSSPFGQCSLLPSAEEAQCGCRVAECPQGALAADAVRFVSDADIALVNGGSVRASIDAGPVAKSAVLQTYPFLNELVRLDDVPGATVRAVLQNSISLLGYAAGNTPSGRFLHISGNTRMAWHFVDGVPTLGAVSIDRGDGVAAPLNDTATYSLATSVYLAGGGDDYDMLEPLSRTALGQTTVDAVSAYLEQLGAPLSDVDLDGRITQHADTLHVQLGIFCSALPAGADAEHAEREECDHAHHMVAAINDKNDGYHDDLLPFVQLSVSEAYSGCSQGLVQGAFAELRTALPQLAAAIGPSCSNDLGEISDTSYRASIAGEASRAVFLSGSSTAPSLADEALYPNVARLTSTENLVQRGLSQVAAQYSWKRIGLLYDDSVWATESAQAFRTRHSATFDDAEFLPNGAGHQFSLAEMDAGRIDATALLQVLADEGVTIVYLATQPRVQSKIFQAAYTSKVLYGAGHGWLSAWLSEASLKDASGNVNPDAVRGAEGVIGVTEAVDTTSDEFAAYSALWAKASSTEACSTPHAAMAYCDSDGDPMTVAGYGAQGADAVLTFAKALDAVATASSRDPATMRDGDTLYAMVKQLPEFAGVAGPVRLDSNGDREGVFEIENLQISHNERRRLFVPLSSTRADFVTVGTWDPSTGITFDPTTMVVFPGAVTIPPVDTPGAQKTAVGSASVGPIVGGAVAATVLVAAVVYGLQWHRSRQKIRKMKQELERFKNAIVGVRAVTSDFDPRDAVVASAAAGSSMAPAASSETGASCELEEVVVEAGNGTRARRTLMFTSDTAETAAPPSPRARWWWQEDESMVCKHHATDVRQPGCWISYAGCVCRELEQTYQLYLAGRAPPTHLVDLTDRIGSTGTEAKAQKGETGVQFTVDFAAMTQANAQSGYVRKVERTELAAAPAAAVAAAPSLAASRKDKRNALKAAAAAARLSTTSTRRTSDDKGKPRLAKPAELAEEDALLLREDQLLQVSKQRPDGWAFGSVVLDPMEDRPPLGVDGVSTQAGWFPLSCTEHPSPAQLEALQQRMGGGEGASDALKSPDTWGQVKDPLVAQMVKLPDGPERQSVVAAFQQTLPGGISVVSVERVQNQSMWQSYAVKRQTIVQREKDNAGASRFERVWLFHGTDEGTVPKIIQQGFNRAFAGKNAVAFGKGVYFARDASYSCSSTYSRPNAAGVQHMFLCRVTTGEFCKGHNGALTPDVRTGHHLYDSTVNDTKNPSIFVTYHDAQAYPEYSP